MGIARQLLVPHFGEYDPNWPLNNFPAVQTWGETTDLRHLFQDAAMITPVTAANQSGAAALDLSGNSRHVVQATGSAQPTVQLATMPNGMQRYVLGFDGGDWLANTSPGALLRNVGGATLICILQTADLAASTAIVQVDRNAADSARAVLTRRRIAARAVGMGARRLDADTFQATEVASAFIPAEWAIQVSRFDYAHSDAWLYYQSSLITSTTSWLTDGVTSDTNSAGISVGATQSGLLPLTGQIGEWIICGADVGLTLLTRFWYEYARPKWGIAV